MSEIIWVRVLNIGYSLFIQNCDKIIIQVTKLKLIKSNIFCLFFVVLRVADIKVEFELAVCKAYQSSDWPKDPYIQSPC